MTYSIVPCYNSNMNKRVYIDIEGICAKMGWSQNNLADALDFEPTRVSHMKKITMVSLTKVIQKIHEVTHLGFEDILIYR